MAAFRVTPARFELERDGHIALLDYRLQNGIANLIHTEVPEELRGGGVGSELVRLTLDWLRQQQVKARVGCPFVAAYLQRHPEYNDLLVK